MSRSRVVVSIVRAAAAIAVVFFAAPRPAAAELPGAESPQALVARMRAGVAAQDLGEVAACVEPGQRRAWAVGMLRKGQMMSQLLGPASEEGGAKPRAVAGSPSAAQRIEAYKPRPEPLRMSSDLMDFHAAILEKHGIAQRLAGRGLAGRSEEELEALFSGVDEAQLIADLTALIDSLLEPGRRVFAPTFPAAEVTDFRVAGDRATARAGAEILELVRVGGRWYRLMPPKGT